MKFLKTNKTLWILSILLCFSIFIIMFLPFLSIQFDENNIISFTFINVFFDSSVLYSINSVDYELNVSLNPYIISYFLLCFLQLIFIFKSRIKKRYTNMAMVISLLLFTTSFFLKNFFFMINSNILDINSTILIGNYILTAVTGLIFIFSLIRHVLFNRNLI